MYRVSEMWMITSLSTDDWCVIHPCEGSFFSFVNFNESPRLETLNCWGHGEPFSILSIKSYQMFKASSETKWCTYRPGKRDDAIGLPNNNNQIQQFSVPAVLRGFLFCGAINEERGRHSPSLITHLCVFLSELSYTWLKYENSPSRPEEKLFDLKREEKQTCFAKAVIWLLLGMFQCLMDKSSTTDPV